MLIANAPDVGNAIELLQLTDLFLKRHPRQQRLHVLLDLSGARPGVGGRAGCCAEQDKGDDPDRGGWRKTGCSFHGDRSLWVVDRLQCGIDNTANWQTACVSSFVGEPMPKIVLAAPWRKHLEQGKSLHRMD